MMVVKSDVYCKQTFRNPRIKRVLNPPRTEQFHKLVSDTIKKWRSSSLSECTLGKRQRYWRYIAANLHCGDST